MKFGARQSIMSKSDEEKSFSLGSSSYHYYYYFPKKDLAESDFQKKIWWNLNATIFFVLVLKLGGTKDLKNLRAINLIWSLYKVLAKLKAKSQRK